MKLCLDVGNSHIYGGVFKDQEIILSFRYDSHYPSTSDQLGVFLRQVLRENALDHQQITKVAICSVVPTIDYSLRSACIKYFKIDPFFLRAGVKTGLKIKYHNPHEVGADRISNAIAAVNQFPEKNLVIFDFGTATTCCVITAKKEYYGGVILPGMRLSMEALGNGAAKLFSVEITKPSTAIGQSTKESIQAGIYYAQLGAAKEILAQVKHHYFSHESFFVLATGGFAGLFSEENIFSTIVPELVLFGLIQALELNSE